MSCHRLFKEWILWYNYFFRSSTHLFNGISFKAYFTIIRPSELLFYRTTNCALFWFGTRNNLLDDAALMLMALLKTVQLSVAVALLTFGLLHLQTALPSSRPQLYVAQQIKPNPIPLQKTAHWNLPTERHITNTFWRYLYSRHGT